MSFAVDLVLELVANILDFLFSFAFSLIGLLLQLFCLVFCSLAKILKLLFSTSLEFGSFLFDVLNTTSSGTDCLFCIMDLFDNGFLLKSKTNKVSFKAKSYQIFSLVLQVLNSVRCGMLGFVVSRLLAGSSGILELSDGWSLGLWQLGD